MCGDLFVTCSIDNNAKVWHAKSLTIRATLPHNDWVRSGTRNMFRFLTLSGDSKIVFFDEWKPSFDLTLPDEGLGRLAHFNEDTVIVPAGQYLYFISLLFKSVLTRIEIGEKVVSCSMLNDGRIAVGGRKGCCLIITPPRFVLEC